MDASSRTDIAVRAYQIWESEGRPDGQDIDHWFRAEAELCGVLALPPAKESEPTAQNRGARRRQSKVQQASAQLM